MSGYPEAEKISMGEQVVESAGLCWCGWCGRMGTRITRPFLTLEGKVRACHIFDIKDHECGLGGAQWPILDKPPPQIGEQP